MYCMILLRAESLQGSALRKLLDARERSKFDAVPGMTFCGDFDPLILPARLQLTRRLRKDGQGELALFRCETRSRDDIKLFSERFPSADAHSFVDMPIEACPPCSNSGAAIGTHADVARLLGLDALRQAGVTGKGVRLAIVDGGIDGTLVPVAGGYCHDSPATFVPGTTRRSHGSMVAFDARIAAPDSRLLDYCMLTPNNAHKLVWLADAAKHFVELLKLLLDKPGSLVINNSWSVYDRSDDLPMGDPAAYCDNPNHIINQLVQDLAAEGADVLFAAGNCGEHAPDARCGATDRGPGKSIHGANSHPMVTTVAAINTRLERVCCSSEGPGMLATAKPDLCGYAGFAGSNAMGGPDSGTSAACAVVAGLVAALRQVDSTINPGQLRQILTATCDPVPGMGFDGVGHGVVNAESAFAALKP